jgi:hypothetical protein
MKREDQVRQIGRLLEAAERDAISMREARIRRQAQNARMALFFLGMGRRIEDSWLARRLGGDGAVDRYLHFALRQVEGLTSRLPQILSQATFTAGVEAVGEHPSFSEQQTPTRARLHQLGELEQQGMEITELFLESSAELTDEAFSDDSETAATEGRSEAEAVSARRDLADQAELKLLAFLENVQASETGLTQALFSYQLPNLLRYLRKNLTLLWAVPLVLFVALGIEAVRSLLWNDRFYTLLYVIVALLPLLVTEATSIWLGRRRRSTSAAPNPVSPVWDVGGSAFRSVSPAVIEPNRLVERWPPSAEGIDPALLESDDPEVRELAHTFRTFAAPRKAGLLRVILWGRLARLGLYALWWLLGGIAVWGASDPSQPYLTVYVIVALLAGLLVFARLIDLWDFLDARPVRFLMLLAGLFAVMMVAAGKEGFFWLPLLALSLGYLIGYLRNRARPMRAFLAVLLAGLAGMSFFKQDTHEQESWRNTGKALERIGSEQWPMDGKDPVVVMAASGGGSRAALYTAFTLAALHEDFPEAAAQLQAISSVSGGSLANAVYTVGRLNGQTVDRESLAAAVGGDFLRPTLKGAATPATSRGRSIESHWERQLGLEETRLGDLIENWKSRDGNPPYPIPLFNTSTLDGHDVVISPLERSYYTRPDLQAFPTSQDSTWVHNRDAIYGLEDFLPKYDPKISSSVRASANFPFGFPLVWIQTEEELLYSPLPEDREPGTKSVYLTDGGALSNSGMWSLFNLLSNQDLLPALRDRGVLLLIVDASKMPTYPELQKKAGALWSAIGDQSPIGQALHRSMLDRLEALYCDRIAVVQLDLHPSKKNNILTTWALSSDRIEELEAIFDGQWKRQRSRLDTSWRALVGLEPGAGECGSFIDRERPPLD